MLIMVNTAKGKRPRLYKPSDFIPDYKSSKEDVKSQRIDKPKWESIKQRWREFSGTLKSNKKT